MCGKSWTGGPKWGAKGLKVGKGPELNCLFRPVEVFIQCAPTPYDQTPPLHFYPQTLPKWFVTRAMWLRGLECW
jgi:hypothetical protein